jgi:hypothetical protein
VPGRGIPICLCVSSFIFNTSPLCLVRSQKSDLTHLFFVSADSDSNDRRQKRQPGKRKDKPVGAAAGPARNNRRASLRIGTGKKARAASLSSRRGSLRKRDRTHEKEAKFAAAEDRRTVSLPECVTFVEF